MPYLAIKNSIVSMSKYGIYWGQIWCLSVAVGSHFQLQYTLNFLNHEKEYG